MYYYVLPEWMYGHPVCVVPIEGDRCETVVRGHIGAGDRTQVLS